MPMLRGCDTCFYSHFYLRRIGILRYLKVPILRSDFGHCLEVMRDSWVDHLSGHGKKHSKSEV
ncbi:MAG: hypothetical protein Q8J62_06730 [Candidatus Cloacimonadaceae bacterium]|nr:hypothetical protein [Candidatus Cloacimonadaceae bacterium]